MIDRNGDELKFDFSEIQYVWGISVLLESSKLNFKVK